MNDSKVGEILFILHLKLQLSAAGLCDLLALLLLSYTRLRVAIPSQCAQSFRQNGMREVVARIHPIGIHCAQILDLELDQ